MIKPKRKPYWGFNPPTLKEGRRGNSDFRELWFSLHWGNIDKHDYYRMVGGVIKWDDNMARKTYRIELKIDFNDDSNHEIILGIAKQYARDLLGSAMLLQDGRPPAVALMTDDTFVGSDEISILPEGGSLHTV